MDENDGMVLTPFNESSFFYDAAGDVWDEDSATLELLAREVCTAF
jgi:hypothetical protein